MAHTEFKKVTEVRLDQNSLPADGQVVWYQVKDENESWQKGIFTSGDNLFINDKGHIALAFEVYHWCALEDAVLTQ